MDAGERPGKLLVVDHHPRYAGQLEAGDADDLLQAITVAITHLENLRAFTSGFAEVVRLPPPGRGLGLSPVQEILSQHGFGFSLAAAPGAPRGKGAEFRLVF